MIRKNKSLIFSLIVAAMMNLIHINIFNTDLTPDFILLALIFWFFKNPNAVSISLFWCGTKMRYMVKIPSDHGKFEYFA